MCYCLDGQKGGRMQKLKVGVEICQQEIAMPQALYSYLEKLAASNGMSVADYITGIVEQAGDSIEGLGWDAFPAEAITILLVYKFCLEDSTSTAKAMRNLKQ